MTESLDNLPKTIKRQLIRLDRVESLEGFVKKLRTSLQQAHIELEVNRPLPGLVYYKRETKWFLKNPHYRKYNHMVGVIGNYLNVSVINGDGVYVVLGTTLELKIFHNLLYYIHNGMAILLYRVHQKQIKLARKHRKLSRAGKPTGECPHTTTIVNKLRDDLFEAVEKELDVLIQAKSEHGLDLEKHSMINKKIKGTTSWHGKVLTTTKRI